MGRSQHKGRNKQKYTTINSNTSAMGRSQHKGRNKHNYTTIITTINTTINSNTTINNTNENILLKIYYCQRIVRKKKN
jgi:hypothetical protein